LTIVWVILDYYLVNFRTSLLCHQINIARTNGLGKQAGKAFRGHNYTVSVEKGNFDKEKFAGKLNYIKSSENQTRYTDKMIVYRVGFSLI
jgi:hypothetical protein